MSIFISISTSTNLYLFTNIHIHMYLYVLIHIHLTFSVVFVLNCLSQNYYYNTETKHTSELTDISGNMDNLIIQKLESVQHFRKSIWLIKWFFL